MTRIENCRHLTRGHLQRDLLTMDDGTLQAQEITQKAALHCLRELQHVGVSDANVTAFLESLGSLGQLVTAEIRRRGLAVVDVEPDDAVYPTVHCPKCQTSQVDMDGFGFLYCPSCHYCKHPSRDDGICGLCGDVEDAKAIPDVIKTPA